MMHLYFDKNSDQVSKWNFDLENEIYVILVILKCETSIVSNIESIEKLILEISVRLCIEPLMFHVSSGTILDLLRCTTLDTLRGAPFRVRASSIP